MEFLVWYSLPHLMQDPWLGEHNETAGLTGLAVAQQFAGGANEIRQVK